VTVAWRYLDAAGGEVGTSAAFDHRDAAEEWLGGAWRELLGRGIEEVELVEDDRVLYRMGLRET
jgi:hypothetical protein